mmetsp:Transcript_26218/g.57349  ORF Transcript_26218/g.57349 Transcript_26218/m.57349 type:complete len:253 (+) Transcript_26218:1130-1888(+)
MAKSPPGITGERQTDAFLSTSFSGRSLSMSAAAPMKVRRQLKMPRTGGHAPLPPKKSKLWISMATMFGTTTRFRSSWMRASRGSNHPTVTSACESRMTITGNLASLAPKFRAATMPSWLSRCTNRTFSGGTIPLRRSKCSGSSFSSSRSLWSSTSRTSPRSSSGVRLKTIMTLRSRVDKASLKKMMMTEAFGSAETSGYCRAWHCALRRSRVGRTKPISLLFFRLKPYCLNIAFCSFRDFCDRMSSGKRRSR